MFGSPFCILKPGVKFQAVLPSLEDYKREQNGNKVLTHCILII